MSPNPSTTPDAASGLFARETRQPIALDRAYFLPDQLHPNAKGQIKIRDHVWPALKGLL